MNHKCTLKMINTVEYFRRDRLVKDGVYVGMAYGVYGECRGCGRRVKAMSILTSDGALKTRLLGVGESTNGKAGIIEFTKEEEEKIWKAK